LKIEKAKQVIPLNFGWVYVGAMRVEKVELKRPQKAPIVAPPFSLESFDQRELVFGFRPTEIGEFRADLVMKYFVVQLVGMAVDRPYTISMGRSHLIVRNNSSERFSGNIVVTPESFSVTPSRLRLGPNQRAKIRVSGEISGENLGIRIEWPNADRAVVIDEFSIPVEQLQSLVGAEEDERPRKERQRVGDAVREKEQRNDESVEAMQRKKQRNGGGLERQTSRKKEQRNEDSFEDEHVRRK
jgi:hypothetical protein